MKIYQFYESKDGSHPSSIDDLKHKAEQAGWQHELYDLKRLLDELTDNDLREAIKRMWRFLPFTMAASATSDFFRYWAL